MQPPNAGRRRQPRVFYGWWIVASFVVLNIYWAGTLIYGLTVFFTPVRQSFGWSAGLLALILSLSSVMNGIVAPFVGAWFDRSGPRDLMLLATACGAVGLVALSLTTSLPAFVAAYGLVSVGFGIWASGTGIAAAGLWFDRRRGLAMGIVLAGVSLGGVLVPVWKLVVDSAGWRAGFAIAGVAMLALSVPACLVLRKRPEDLGLRPDGASPGERPPNQAPGPTAVSHAEAEASQGSSLMPALRSAQFWVVAAAAAVVVGASQAAQLLMLPRFKDAGLADTAAVTAVTVVTLLGVVARLGNGWLSDRFPAPHIAAAGFALQSIGLLAFAAVPASWAGLLVFVLAFGLGSDNIRLLASVIFSRYFGLAALGRIQGCFYLALLPGRVIGPVFVGALHDRGGAYELAFTVLALLTLAMVVPMLLLRPPARATERARVVRAAEI